MTSESTPLRCELRIVLFHQLVGPRSSVNVVLNSNASTNNQLFHFFSPYYLIIEIFPGKKIGSDLESSFLNPHGSGEYTHARRNRTSLNKLEKRRNRWNRVRILIHCHYGLPSWRLEKQSLDFSCSLFVYEKRGLQLGHLGYTRIKLHRRFRFRFPYIKASRINQKSVFSIHTYPIHPRYSNCK